MPGEHGVGDRLGDLPDPQNQRQQDSRAQDAGDGSAAAGADIDHRAHGRSGAGETTDQPRGDVADALTHQLAVGVVRRAGEGIGYQRGQQTVNGAEERENERRLQETDEDAGGKLRPLKLRQARWHGPR